MEKLKSLFNIFYGNCLRQEADSTNQLMVLHLKRFKVKEGIYECTEREFNALLSICRKISKECPSLLSVEENVSYHDPLNKIIGSHDFMTIPNDREVERLFVKYYQMLGPIS